MLGGAQLPPWQPRVPCQEGIASRTAPRQRCRPGPAVGLLLQEVLQLARAGWVAQLAERLGLDLADPLAGDVELPADLLERPGAAVLEPVAELKDPPLTSVQRVEDGRHLLLEERPRGGLVGGERGGIFDEVAEGPVRLLADRRIEGDRLVARLGDLADLVGRDHDLLAPRHRLADLLHGRLATEFREQLARDADHPVDRLHHVDRDPDRAGLVGDGPRDGLADPPVGIRRELEAALVVELLDRPDQADVALLDQVEQAHPAADVLLGDRDDEAEVRAGQLLPGVPTHVDQHPIPLAELRVGRNRGVVAHVLEQIRVVAGEDPAFEGRERHAIARPAVERPQAHVVPRVEVPAVNGGVGEVQECQEGIRRARPGCTPRRAGELPAGAPWSRRTRQPVAALTR